MLSCSIAGIFIQNFPKHKYAKLKTVRLFNSSARENSHVWIWYNHYHWILTPGFHFFAMVCIRMLWRGIGQMTHENNISLHMILYYVHVPSQFLCFRRTCNKWKYTAKILFRQSPIRHSDYTAVWCSHVSLVNWPQHIAATVQLLYSHHVQ